jgi:hypothetical protein
MDICQLGDPGVKLAQIQQGRVKQAIFPALGYACCYWVHHVHEADLLSSQLAVVFAFLREQLLHWLEALTLLGRLKDAMTCLGELELLTVSESSASQLWLV